MPKKRVIFTLLYADGSFMLSRNFRLQRVGDGCWLQNNYNFAHVSRYIDELVVLDVSRQSRDAERFMDMLKKVAEASFVPIAAGGGVRSVADAKALLRAGADKVVVNTPLFDDVKLVEDLATEFGQQCVVGSIDMKREADGRHAIWTEAGKRKVEGSPKAFLQVVDGMAVGELYLCSIDRDGTGQGFDFDLLGHLPSDFSKPLILAGGAGNPSHIAGGICEPRVDAVATAHLFNFVADGLKLARNAVLDAGHNLARWPDLETLPIRL